MNLIHQSRWTCCGRSWVCGIKWRWANVGRIRIGDTTFAFSLAWSVHCCNGRVTWFKVRYCVYQVILNSERYLLIIIQVASDPWRILLRVTHRMEFLRINCADLPTCLRNYGSQQYCSIVGTNESKMLTWVVLVRQVNTAIVITLDTVTAYHIHEVWLRQNSELDLSAIPKIKSNLITVAKARFFAFTVPPKNS